MTVTSSLALWVFTIADVTKGPRQNNLPDFLVLTLEQLYSHKTAISGAKEMLKGRFLPRSVGKTYDESESKQQADESPPLRQVSAEALKQIIEAHRNWLAGNRGLESKPADLSRCNLRGVDLKGIDLRMANLEEADLTGANLTEARFSHGTEDENTMANLSGAKLDRANLGRAILDGVCLSRASLRHAFFSNAKASEARLDRADLTEANFYNSSLGKSNLYEANLSGACLDSADLEQANLTFADVRAASLRRCKLRGADLTGAILQDVDLQDADLSGATGIMAGQLAGANLSGAKLPEPILKFEGLARVQEASKNTGKLLISMLLGCVYAWLTIGTTTDAGLLTNFPSSPLPILGAAIPIVEFYWAGPLFLIGLYLYFHLYLQRLWEALAQLPAVFPDGQALDGKVYPSLLNGLVRTYFARLRDIRPPLSRLQTAISSLPAWWAVPFTLLFFWLRFLRRHDWFGTSLHILLLVIAVGAAILFQHLAAATLRGMEKRLVLRRGAWKDARIYKRILFLLGVGTTFSLISFGAIDGVRPPQAWIDGISFTSDSDATNIQKWVPKAFAMIRYSPFADLVEADVSGKPANWSGQKPEELVLVKGARLKGANLRYAFADHAFLVNADLRKADLRGAELLQADLRRAQLQLADLRGAILFEGVLEGAHFRQADLRGSILSFANFRKAFLVNADLRKADLWGANLQEANLRKADLRGSKLFDADLTGAIVTEAMFENADLRGAVLTNAIGLSRQQIESALINETTRLPAYLQPSQRGEKKAK